MSGNAQIECLEKQSCSSRANSAKVIVLSCAHAITDVLCIRLRAQVILAHAHSLGVAAMPLAVAQVLPVAPSSQA